MEELSNIMENLVLDSVKKMMESRQNICKCAHCRLDIIAYALNRLPSKYITTDVGGIYAVIEQTKSEFQVEINKAIEEAFETIDKNPRHLLKTKLLYGEEQAFNMLLEKIFDDRGLDCRQYQQKCLKRRVLVRMRAKNVHSYAEYLRILMTDSKEYEELFNTLTINVSEFFRNPEAFDAFKNLALRSLIRDKKKLMIHTIRIWSAGCAGGEEPYSIAILIKELLENEPWRFSAIVYGTDIDKESLEQAKLAEYERKSIEKVNKQLLTKYFDYVEGIYRLKNEIKDLVKLQYHNLVADRAPAKFDAIFCRNVMIYFNHELQNNLYKRFYSALNPGGFLVTGKVEMIQTEGLRLFRRVNARERIYQRLR